MTTKLIIMVAIVALFSGCTYDNPEYPTTTIPETTSIPTTTIKEKIGCYDSCIEGHNSCFSDCRDRVYDECISEYVFERIGEKYSLYQSDCEYVVQACTGTCHGKNKDVEQCKEHCKREDLIAKIPEEWALNISCSLDGIGWFDCTHTILNGEDINQTYFEWNIFNITTISTTTIPETTTSIIPRGGSPGRPKFTYEVTTTIPCRFKPDDFVSTTDEHDDLLPRPVSCKRITDAYKDCVFEVGNNSAINQYWLRDATLEDCNPTTTTIQTDDGCNDEIEPCIKYVGGVFILSTDIIEKYNITPCSKGECVILDPTW